MPKEKEIQNEIENQIKTDYRNGNFKICDACGEVILGKSYQFGGEICANCFEGVGKNLK